MIRLPRLFGDLAPQDLARYDAALLLPPADLARAALAGDPFARYVARLSAADRWFELTGDIEAPLPVALLAAEARKQRRRRTRRRP